jgi:uncharacterized YccA/Bax inhibitor family protein
MSANPVLSPQRWQEIRAEDQPGWAAPTAGGAAATDLAMAAGTTRPAPPVTAERTMTIGGTLTATGVLFVLLLATGWVGWSQVTQTETTIPATPFEPAQTVVSTNYPGWVFLPMLGALVVGLVTAFVPKLARVTAPLYALGYGFAIGAISHMYDLQFDGIVLQAVGATLAVFAVVFVLYATRIVRVTPKFVLVTVAAMGGILVLYLVSWIAALFGADITFWNEPTPLGIGISVVICIVAAMSLAIDFAFIEEASRAGMPKYMEWYGAFGLTVTLIWLYLEILRLLSLLRQ